MSAAIHAFPIERRSVPRNAISTVARARHSGAAENFYKAQERQRNSLERERAEQLGIVRSPFLMLALAMFQSLSASQRIEIKKAVTQLAGESPKDQALQGALWLLRGEMS